MHSWEREAKQCTNGGTQLTNLRKVQLRLVDFESLSLRAIYSVKFIFEEENHVTATINVAKEGKTNISQHFIFFLTFNP